MPLKLYKVNRSPPARAAMITAQILKVDHEAVEVDMTTAAHKSPEYLKKNPMHTVPLLEDGDFYLADSHAIMIYLVSKYGENHADLYPTDLQLRATVNQRLFFEASVLFPTMKDVAKEFWVRKGVKPTEQQIADVNDAYNTLEAYLSKTKYVACDHLTLADISCVTIVSTLEVVVPIEPKHVKIHAWLNNLKQQDWYKNYNAPGVGEIVAFFKMLIKNNSEST